MNTRKVFFLTGATGLIGSYFLKVLLENKHKVFCLVRRKKLESPERRIHDALKFWTKNLHLRNLFVLAGDVSKSNLGLSRRTIESLGGQVNEVVHCAATTDFQCPLSKLRRINVHGTENLIRLFMPFKEQVRINFMSTIYVCGNYTKVFKENMLTVGQNFEIPYEQSKYEAEKLIYKYRVCGMWIDIFRVPAVLCESTTGKIPTFNQAFYQGLRILNSGIFSLLPCKNTYLNTVFVDQLCQSVFCIITSSKSRNQCYHPFDQNGMDMEKFLSLASRMLRIKQPRFVTFVEFEKSNPSFPERMMLKYNYQFLNRVAKFYSRKTTQLLKSHGFAFHKFDKKKMMCLLKYSINKGFIRKKAS